MVTQKFSSNTYFFGLDAFRALAALLVIFGHVELIEKNGGYENQYHDLPFFMAQGDLAVTFFFVLSGFLISILLFHEKEKFKSVSIQKFYLRRIYRIWPLYFLVTLIGFSFYFYTSRDDLFLSSFGLHLLVLPNIAQHSNPLAFQSWSIGVEEQFYLLWPWLFLLDTKAILKAMIFIVVGIYVVRALPTLADQLQWKEGNNVLLDLKTFFGKARYDNMAIGGIMAYMFYFKQFELKKIFKFVVFGTVLTLMTFKVEIGLGLGNILYSILFALAITSIARDTREDSFLEKSPLKYLGKISYGIYMWHVIAIRMALLVADRLPIHQTDWFWSVSVHVLSIILTVLLAMVSFELFEKYFLRLKAKHAYRANGAKHGMVFQAKVQG